MVVELKATYKKLQLQIIEISYARSLMQLQTTKKKSYKFEKKLKVFLQK